MTTTARSLPRLARLLAAAAAVTLPSFAQAASSSSISLGDPEILPTLQPWADRLGVATPAAA